MKIAYLDCFSGISGDMMLGALVDAGCEVAQIESHLRRLSLDGWKITAAKVTRQGLRATQVTVEFQASHHHRSLSDILGILKQSALPPASDRARIGRFQAVGGSRSPRARCADREGTFPRSGRGGCNHRHRRNIGRVGVAGRRGDHVLGAECGWRAGEDAARRLAGARSGDCGLIARGANVFERDRTRVGHSNRCGDCHDTGVALRSAAGHDGRGHRPRRGRR